MDLTNTFRTFHPKEAEFSLSAHGTFFGIDYRTSLSKFKKIKIIPSIFSNHSGMKQEINYRKKTGKHKHVEVK